MTLPFISDEPGLQYESKAWPGLRVHYGDRHLLLEAPMALDRLSSAVFGGGPGEVQRMVNVYVDRFYSCEEPERDISRLLEEWGYPQERTAGLLTAAKLKHAAIAEEKTGEFAVFCCATAGVSNAARAGVQRTTFPASWMPGTINLLLAIDGRLTPAAMLGAVITATEAKAAALQDLGVRDAENGLTATGTTTDAVVLGVSQRADWPLAHAYAGTATDLGGTVSRLVYTAVTESLRAAAAERRL